MSYTADSRYVKFDSTPATANAAPSGDERDRRRDVARKRSCTHTTTATRSIFFFNTANDFPLDAISTSVDVGSFRHTHYTTGLLSAGARKPQRSTRCHWRSFLFSTSGSMARWVVVVSVFATPHICMPTICSPPVTSLLRKWAVRRRSAINVLLTSSQIHDNDE
jgi:hypothetical protein